MSFVIKRGGTLKKNKSKSIDEPVYTESNLPSLRRKRTVAYNRVSRALEIGNQATFDETKIGLFLSYCQELKSIYASFQDSHFVILELLDQSEGVANDTENVIQEQFDEKYFQVLALQREFNKVRQPVDSQQQTSTTGAQSNNMRLPKISLPTFSGVIKEWPEFIATFNALIHESSVLSEIEKFHYLVSVLRGDALSLIRTFPVSGEHYASAYEALKSRFEDKRELAFTCWRDVLGVTFKTNNAHDFRRSLDMIDENLSILQKLGLPIKHWDFILCYNIFAKLDTKLRREFEEKHTDIEFPSYQQLRCFLHSKCEALIRDTHFTEIPKVNHMHKDQPSTSHASKRYNRSNVSHSLVAPSLNANTSNKNKHEAKPTKDSNVVKFVRKCSYCGAEHHISACEAFLSKSVDERITVAGEKRWCYNCLNASHSVKECTSIFSCQKCKRKHHTLLHREHVNNSHASSKGQPNSLALIAKESVPLSSVHSSNTTVLLATALVQIRDTFGEFHTFRALFDTGSQNNFLTEHAAQRLNLKPTVSLAQVQGLGGSPASITGTVKCDIGANHTVRFSLDMFVITNICGDQPIAKLNTSGWDEVKTLPLADPGFDIPGPIDVLLGADVFAESLLDQRLKGSASQPRAFNSVFGWLLLGKTRLASTSLLGVASSNVDDALNSIVQRFWEIDNVPQSDRLTPEEQCCESSFVSNHYRDETGRYVVCLPFRENSEPVFEGSRDIALRRFHAIEKRLSRDQSLKQQYIEFMTDYTDSGHMSLVPAKQMGQGKYYIPHHCVLRPDSATTKLRVVFDASAKDANSKSLNDSLLIGPKLQSNIAEILLHYREHAVVFMADVRQMYRQIFVAPQHRDYQRILWRADADEPLQEYVLNTVTYGVSSAPFLACRTVQQLAIDEGHKYPKAKAILTSDVYIDDIVTGSESLEDARDIKAQIIALFGLGSFELRKWVSNRPELLDDLPPESCLSEAITFTEVEDTTIKVLGLKWEPASDSFVFHVQPTNQPCTKRVILSEVARIFDPLGFLSPVTIQAKCLIQKLWVMGVTWDEPPPSDVFSVWDKFAEQLPQIKNLKIPRRYTTENVKSYQLHGFCDSSEAAYGAVIYLRVTQCDDSVQVFFVCGKARVAPLKRQSLPRLELCGAVLLANLLKFVKATLRFPIDETYLWCDSTVTLAWLRAPSSRWATFVANRVSHIQDITSTECWRHVPSSMNPADVCSRGQSPQDLLSNDLWWAGPPFLHRPPSKWPEDVSRHQNKNNVALPEQRSAALVTERTDTATQPSIIDNLLERFSSLDIICRILAYIRRFCRNTRDKSQRSESILITETERYQSLLTIVKHFQGRHFSNVIDMLQTRKTLPRSFRKLSPFVDDQGVLRVGGRLSRSGLEFDHKHPALLPKKCALTSAVIDSIHRKTLHPGLNTTHYLIQQQFWILAAKRAIRHHLSKCIRCYRLHPQPLQPFMSDLPAFRVNQAKPFSEVGVDFGGPFRIKLGRHRGAKIDKAYLCLFVCLCTKAVHLEVVSTLSTDGFIAALRRFVSRRGRCNIIHADCGTNFVGASTQLASYMEQASHTEKIAFKFNPPSAAHFGGAWEIQIKAAKTHLYRIAGTQTLTFEELATLFTQIEAIMNSRPLCPLSSDPNDLTVLTPGHFLTLEPLTAVPDLNYTETVSNRLNRWQLIQSFQQQFWKRWSNEYLQSLTQRAKWNKESKPLELNSIVLIKDDIRSPLQWPLGRVVALHPGPDQVIRVATVRTAKDHLLKRPLVKLCPLPIEHAS